MKIQDPELGNFIRRHREAAGHHNKREIHEAIKKSRDGRGLEWISYSYYQQIESNGLVPEIDIFFAITNFLNIDELKASLHYSASIQPTPRLREHYLRQLEDGVSASLQYEVNSDRADLDQVYDITPDEARFFAKNLEAYDLAYALCETMARSLEDLARVTGHPKTTVRKYLDELIRMQLVYKRANEYQFIKKTLRLIGNASNRDIQWDLSSRHLRSSHTKFYDPTMNLPKYRFSAVVPMLDSSASKIVHALRKDSKQYDAAEIDPSERTRAYHLSILFCPRFHEELGNEKEFDK